MRKKNHVTSRLSWAISIWGRISLECCLVWITHLHRGIAARKGDNISWGSFLAPLRISFSKNASSLGGISPLFAIRGYVCGELAESKCEISTIKSWILSGSWKSWIVAGSNRRFWSMMQKIEGHRSWNEIENEYWIFFQLSFADLCTPCTTKVYHDFLTNFYTTDRAFVNTFGTD